MKDPGCSWSRGSQKLGTSSEQIYRQGFPHHAAAFDAFASSNQSGKLKNGCLKYREFAVQTEISKFFISGETFSKITITVSKEFSFARKPANGEMLPHALVAGQKPLNKTIFNALGKKDGSRKQVHLWQVSKASQLQYYSVKILQDNELFTRFKNARRFLSSALSWTMKFCETLKEKITAWYVEF